MDVKKKEMDLLSNSIAAYAHIKGKSCSEVQHSARNKPLPPSDVAHVHSFPQQTRRASASTLCSECASAWC